MKINPLVDCKEYTFKQRKGKRVMETTIFLNNGWIGPEGMPTRLFHLRISIYNPTLNAYAEFDTDDKILSESLFQSKKKAIEFAQREVRQLADAYLNGLNYFEEIKHLHKKYHINYIYNVRYNLYNYRVPTLLAYGCSWPGSIPLLVKPHNLLWLMRDIMEFREVDLSKRTIIQANLFVEDLFYILGVKKFYPYERDMKYLHLMQKNKEILQFEYLPISNGLFERKLDTLNFFTIEDNTRVMFLKEFAKFAVMHRKPHLLVTIDDNYNIKTATIRH